MIGFRPMADNSAPVGGIQIFSIQEMEQAEQGKEKKPNIDLYSQSKPTSATERKMPLNFFFPLGIQMERESEVVDVSKRITAMFQQYYQGYTTEKTVTEGMAKAVSDLMEIYTDMGYDAKNIAPQIIEDVFDRCKLDSISAAGSASFLEGKALAAKYNANDVNSHDFLYYNADYHYKTEDMKLQLVRDAKTIAAKYGVDEQALDLPLDYQDGDLRKGYYASYTTNVNEHARSMRGSNILDENLVPPRGFRLFYKGNDSGTNQYPASLVEKTGEPEAEFDGVVQMWYGEWTFTDRVPVRFDATKYPISVNLFDVVFRAGKHEMPQELIPMLKNFDFYTSVQSGPYQKAHPRRLG